MYKPFQESSGTCDDVAVEGVLGGRDERAAGQQGDDSGGDDEGRRQRQRVIGSRHVHHDDKGERGRDGATGRLSKEIRDPLARHRLNGGVNDARREEAQHAVHDGTAEQGRQPCPHETNVHSDEPLTVQPGAARDGGQAVGGLLEPHGLVANVIDEQLQFTQALVVVAAGTNHPQRGDGVFVQSTMLGDDDGRVRNIDVDGHSVGRGDAQGYCDGLRRGTSYRDRHHRDAGDEVDDTSSLHDRHLSVAQVESQSRLYRCPGAKEFF